MIANDKLNVLTAQTPEMIGFAGDEIRRISTAIQQMADRLESHQRELQNLMHLTARVNEGMFLDDVLQGTYRDFKNLIPYNRIGLSLIEDNGTMVRARWAQADYSPVFLSRNFAGRLEGSTLEMIIRSGRPRIINDLELYYSQKPSSVSTRLILDEGIRSSLTCPLIANGIPIGFMFFSSCHPNTYADVHTDIFQQIAGQLAVMIEKGRLLAALGAQKKELEQKNQELRQLNEVKNAVMGMAIHDLRNPLSSVLMSTSLLKNRAVTLTQAERDEIIADIDQQASHMFTLVNDMLDVSQIETGQFTIFPESIKMSPFLADIVQRHNHAAESKRCTVILETTSQGKAVADPKRLRQVMDNLLLNAVKFAPAYSKIYVRAKIVQGMWHIDVQDEGPGLCTADQAMLFDDFARLTRHKHDKTTGLGLAITQRIIRAHGGEIGVESKVGDGATFWFSLYRCAKYIRFTPVPRELIEAQNASRRYFVCSRPASRPYTPGMLETPSHREVER
ncbi:MAG: GAF domain-containing sensor histidine kinase [Chloroflexi bacterium]|uniref:sensor histidine kinase n=1 Tax=Candidatus Flexifilum breve TaxID=3140694 RepID=UPI003136AE01|nr:GAF domain-containing sensor histidine kinase [Chloroflexota bacterium]MBK9747204.1 GAF domain-containing sensor histidine kinase [Chloroflexota bacterium]